MKQPTIKQILQGKHAFVDAEGKTFYKDNIVENAMIEYGEEISERNKELLECLKVAYEQIKISEKQIPLNKSFNLNTPNGKAGWELFSARMVRIENAINKNL